MRALAWLPLACLLVCSACASSGSGWDPLAATPEPLELPDGMDDRDPHAYYLYGQQILAQSPARAATAFYWASRLDPSWGTPLYARRMALLMADPYIFDRYMQGDRRVLQYPGVQRLDSLYLRALVLNPFPQRQEDSRAFRSLMVHRVRNYLTRSSRTTTVDDAAIGYMVDDYLAREDGEMRAWLAYSEGRYGVAAAEYERALKRRSESPYLHADYARCLFMLGRHHEARSEMGRAVELLGEREDDELVRVYESKALYNHSLGLIHEAVGNQTGARESYAQALQEDLAYFPAHMRLAELALAAGDTLTATSEMALAVEIDPDDAAIRYRHGLLLNAVRRWVEAEAELRAAVELEPLFAAPYHALAVALERQGRTEEAAAEYARFIEKASPSAPGVAESREWLERAAASR